jgi:hypothetical protein
MGPRSLGQAWPRLGVGRWALAALAAVRLDGATPRTRQARKNPPEAHRDMIRVQGLLAHRPPGQTSWSKALARHGADPGVALAGVLGVPAEDIRGEGPLRADDPLTVPDPEAALHDDRAEWRGGVICGHSPELCSKKRFAVAFALRNVPSRHQQPKPFSFRRAVPSIEQSAGGIARFARQKRG